MSESVARNGQSQDEAEQIIEKYGDAAISYMVQLIEEAVRASDDTRVDRLDRLMRDIEDRLSTARRPS